jgi:hypothetical protein
LTKTDFFATHFLVGLEEIVKKMNLLLGGRVWISVPQRTGIIDQQETVDSQEFFTELGCTVKVIHPQQKFDVCFPAGWDMTLESVGDTKGAIKAGVTTFGDDGHPDPLPHVAHLYDPEGRHRGVYTFGFGGSDFRLTSPAVP